MTQPTDDAASRRPAPGQPAPTEMGQPAARAASGPAGAPSPPGYGGPPGYGSPTGFAPPAGYGWPALGPAPVPLSPDGRRLAGFGDRLAAYLIDMAVLTATFSVIFIPVFVIFLATRMPEFMTSTDPYAAEPDPSVVWEQFLLPLLLLEALLFLVVLVAYYVYHVELMWRGGQTIGKKVLKIRVVPLDPTRRLTRGAAVKRYAVAVLAGSLVPLLSIVDGLWQLWDKPFQQTLHDKVAGTVVVMDGPAQVPA